MSSPTSYDFIIAGAGCAGLSLLMQMIDSGKFDGARILLADKDAKNKNDRTWCFWETTPGPFESIVYHRWPQAWFHGQDFSKLLDLQPYEYKLIRGIDFYDHCFSVIKSKPNIDIATGEIKEIVSGDNDAWMMIGDRKVTARYIFNSILFEKPVIGKKDYYLLQHFKGWTIKTETDLFNPAEATLMDFRVDQGNGTTFVYVMPFAKDRALVEYTLFTTDLLKQDQYDAGLRKYLSQFLQTDKYTVTEEEFGVIPMTNYRFPRSGGQVINIGTAGGQTKASSGYTFQFIQKHSAAIVKQLMNGQPPLVSVSPGRFRFYDSTLLNILQHNKLPGHEIFTTLFKKNKPPQVLRFLDNESSLIDELKIISSLPTLPFLKAAFF